MSNNNFKTVKTIETLINIVKTSVPEASNFAIKPETTFDEIPGVDSMSIVNIQMDLKEEFGDKVYNIQIMPSMSVQDLFDMLV